MKSKILLLVMAAALGGTTISTYASAGIRASTPPATNSKLITPVSNLEEALANRAEDQLKTEKTSFATGGEKKLRHQYGNVGDRSVTVKKPKEKPKLIDTTSRKAIRQGPARRPKYGEAPRVRSREASPSRRSRSRSPSRRR